MYNKIIKSSLVILLGCTLSVSIFAQSSQTININFSGINNKSSNYQVTLDGSSFFSNINYTINNNNQNSAIVNNVQTGKHNLKVYKLKNNDARLNSTSKKTFVYNKTFELREGYDMDITITVSGRVQFSENASDNVQSNVNRPMANYQFNQLLQSVRSKWSQALKGETVSEALNNTNNYFSASQVKQLLILITSENDRLDLAKLSYRAFIDSANFAQVYDLFKTQSSKEELNDFLRAKGWNIPNGTTGVKVPMAVNKFNSLLQSVRSKFSQALKGETVSDAFNTPNNYFSSYQVKQLLTLINSENDRLDLAKLSYPSVTDSTNFTQLYDLFKIQANKDEFNEFLRAKGWNIAYGPNNIKGPMPDNKFNPLLQNVRSKWSQALKGETISEAFNNTNNYFNTSQVKQLLTLITSENDRLELAKLSYSSIIDSANFIQLYDLFQIQSNKDELNNFLRTKGWNTGNNQTNIKTPMADAEFNQLVSNVRGNLIQLLKVNYERDVFVNSNNYFSTNQIRQLLLIINAESNRLELAKLAYKSVTDPSNYLQINNILDTQSSRDDLSNYVKNYRF